MRKRVKEHYKWPELLLNGGKPKPTVIRAPELFGAMWEDHSFRDAIASLMLDRASDWEHYRKSLVELD